MFFMVSRLWFRIKDIDFEINCFFGMHQVLQNQGHFLWLALDADQRFFYFKINFLFDFSSSASSLLIISKARHILDGDSSLIQSKEYWFWNQTFLWNVSSASTSLFVARGRHGHFEWLAFDTDQRFLYFKINFRFDLCFKVAYYF